MEESYSLYAIRYARRANADEMGPAASPPVLMDYFTWVAISADRVVAVDAGFTPQTAEAKGRVFLRSPIDSLHDLGVEAAKVETVILSHLHYDHTGYVSAFENAQFVLQEREMAFWTGKFASRSRYRHLVDGDDLSFLVRANLDSRVVWVDGDTDVVPGISVHWVGGHTAGQQVIRITTPKGYAVLTSDAVHFYGEIDDDEPYNVVHYVPDMYESFEKIRSLADSPELIVAGHDPKVRERFSPVSPFEEYITRIA